jgi:hypothetical protein
VGAGALDGAWLESTFHGVLPGSSTTGRNGPRFKRPGILEKASSQVNFQPVFLAFTSYTDRNGIFPVKPIRTRTLDIEIKEGKYLKLFCKAYRS